MFQLRRQLKHNTQMEKIHSNEHICYDCLMTFCQTCNNDFINENGECKTCLKNTKVSQSLNNIIPNELIQIINKY